METAYLVYTILPGVMMVFAELYKYAKPGQKKLCIILPILLFSSILGLRYNVGKDFPNYWLMLEGDHGERSSIEILFGLFNSVISSLGLSPSVGFIIYSFVQINFFIRAIKFSPKLLFWGIFFYFSTTYIFLSLNVIRQTMAFSILLWSTWFIHRKELVKYLICVTCAAGIHFSAVIFFPIYFLINKEYFRKKAIQIILLSLAFVTGPIIQKILWFLVPFFGQYVLGIEYSDVDMMQLEAVEWNESGLGLGYFLWYFIGLLIITYYDSIKKYFCHKIFIIWYNLYFIGALLVFLVGSTYLSRINIYFDNFKIVIYAIFAAFLFNTHSKYYLKSITLVLFLIVMLAFYYVAIIKKASDCAPFQFV